MGRAAFLQSSVAVGVAVTAVGLAATAPGCSFATNETAIQCTSEADCLSLGPEFAGTTCDGATKSCVKVASDQGLCKTNQECVDKAGGADAICRKRDRTCVTLRSPECPTVIAQPGQLLSDEAVVIGAITPAGAGEAGDLINAAIELAQIDLSKIGGRGLPSVTDSPDTRPLVVVACREFGTGGYDSVVRAAQHLARNVEVPVVIGPVDPANAALTASQVFNPRRILSILPTGTSSVLATLPNPIAPTPLVWSPSYGDVEIAQAAGEFVSKVLEPAIRAQGETTLRIAVLGEDNFLGQTTADLVQAQLRFNDGKTAVENASASPPAYLRVSMGDLIDPVGNPAPESKIAAAIGAIYQFKPHIIFHSYALLAIAPTFFPLVFNYPPPGPGTPAPVHIDVVATFGSFPPLNEVVDVLSNPAIPAPGRLNARLFSMTGHLKDFSRNSAWVLKFKNQFPQFAMSDTPNSAIVQSWYDSTYLAAYAIVANGRKPLTGENLATTLQQLSPPGQAINTGTDDVPKAFGILGSGQPADINGLSGSLDMDPRTGRANYDISVTCPVVGADGRSRGFKDSGFYTERGVGVGVPSCPASL